MSRHHWRYFGCQCSSARCRRLLLERLTLFGIRSAEIMSSIDRALVDGLAPCRVRQVRFQSNSGLPCCPYDLQRALLADGVRPLEDPVLPRGQPAEDLRLHRLRPGEAQIRFEAGQRVGRQRRARFDRQPHFVVPVDFVGRERDEARLLGVARRRTGRRRASSCRDASGVAEEPRLQPRQAVAHRQQPAVHRRQRRSTFSSFVVVEHVRAIGRERQLEQRPGERGARLDEREEACAR